MASATIKGVAFQSVASDVNKLRASGAITESDLRGSIKPEERRFLTEAVIPGLWYPLGIYGACSTFSAARTAATAPTT